MPGTVTGVLRTVHSSCATDGCYAANAALAAAKTSSSIEYALVKSTAPFTSSTTHVPTSAGKRSTPIVAAAAIAIAAASGGGAMGSRRAPRATFVRHWPVAATRLTTLGNAGDGDAFGGERGAEVVPPELRLLVDQVDRARSDFHERLLWAAAVRRAHREA